MIDLEAIFNPRPLWGEPLLEAAPVPTTPAASRLDAPAQAQDATAIGAGLDAPVESSTVQAPKRFDLERIPTQARPLLEEFAQGMGEDLLAVSPIGCRWPDCRFPATVLIRTQQAIKGEMVSYLVWGCPRCGREYRPKVLSPQQFDRVETGPVRPRREET